MKIELTDSEITRIAKELTSNPKCHVVLANDDGKFDSVPDGKGGWKWSNRICNATLSYAKGKVIFHNTCCEPCTFVCKTSTKFQESVSIIKRVVEAINLIKTVDPSKPPTSVGVHSPGKGP